MLQDGAGLASFHFESPAKVVELVENNILLLLKNVTVRKKEKVPEDAHGQGERCLPSDLASPQSLRVKTCQPQKVTNQHPINFTRTHYLAIGANRHLHEAQDIHLQNHLRISECHFQIKKYTRAKNTNTEGVRTVAVLVFLKVTVFLYCIMRVLLITPAPSENFSSFVSTTTLGSTPR